MRFIHDMLQVYNTIRVHPENQPYSDLVQNRRLLKPGAEPGDENIKRDLIMPALLGTVLAFRDLELEQPFTVQGVVARGNSRGVAVTTVPRKVGTLFFAW